MYYKRPSSRSETAAQPRTSLPPSPTTTPGPSPTSFPAPPTITPALAISAVRVKQDDPSQLSIEARVIGESQVSSYTLSIVDASNLRVQKIDLIPPLPDVVMIPTVGLIPGKSYRIELNGLNSNEDIITQVSTTFKYMLPPTPNTMTPVVATFAVHSTLTVNAVASPGVTPTLPPALDIIS